MYPKVPDWVGKDVAVGLRPEHFELADGNIPPNERFKVLPEFIGGPRVGSPPVHFKMDAYPIAPDDFREAVDVDDVFAKIQEAAWQSGSTFTARLEPSAAR